MSELAAVLMFSALAVSFGIWRIGSFVKHGINEHVKAMQAIYEEIAKSKRC